MNCPTGFLLSGLYNAVELPGTHLAEEAHTDVNTVVFLQNQKIICWVFSDLGGIMQ